MRHPAILRPAAGAGTSSAAFESDSVVFMTINDVASTANTDYCQRAGVPCLEADAVALL
jgi:hypothetical protein